MSAGSAPAWERQLRPNEHQLVAQIADAAEGALGSRDPALLAELIARLLAGVVFDLSINGADEATEQLTLTMLDHVLHRVSAIAAETHARLDAVIAAATEAGRA